MNLKYQLQREMISLNYLVNHILYEILIIILSISSKKNGTVNDNPPMRIYINEINNRITIKIKAGYY